MIVHGFSQRARDPFRGGLIKGLAGIALHALGSASSAGSAQYIVWMSRFHPSAEDVLVQVLGAKHGVIEIARGDRFAHPDLIRD